MPQTTLNAGSQKGWPPGELSRAQLQNNNPFNVSYTATIGTTIRNGSVAAGGGTVNFVINFEAFKVKNTGNGPLILDFFT